MNIDITPLVGAMITLLATVITVVVVPWLRSKTTAEQQALIRFWVIAAVQSAEMLYKGGGKGKEKLEYVRSLLADRGITLKEDALRALIESAVLELKTFGVAVESIAE